MSRPRLARLAALSFALVVACDRSRPAPALLGARPAARVVATFTGVADPERGTLTLGAAPAAELPALTAWEPFQDGTVGTGPVNTFELVTERQGQYPGVEPGGCGGGVDAYRAEITLRSFFRSQTLRNVHAEITEVTGGFEGCAGAAPVAGVSAASGLWAYPAIAPGDAATATWRFRFQTSQRFTFRGRIMADLDAPVPVAGAPELDWAPSMIDARRSFRPVETTKAHLVWNGETFVDEVGSVAFTAHGTPGSTFSPVPGAARSSGDGYFVATAATGGDPFDMSGDFTVCVKFKPGAQPPWFAHKVLVAKGGPGLVFGSGAQGEGWGLVQAPDAYAFAYWTAADAAAGRGEVSIWAWQLDWTPASAAYDYMCGGRAGTSLFLQVHGTTVQAPGTATETGTFAGHGATLPLVIGGYADGTRLASDGGVYEVILDSRGASQAVMKEIVDAAEARTVPGSPAVLAEPSAAATTFVAADGVAYGLPPYATPPLSPDGTGLLGAGQIVRYLHPLAENTRELGYCVGAEVVATADWADVGGGVLGLDDGWTTWGWSAMWLGLNPLRLHDAEANVDATSWVAGAGGAHVFAACAAPTGEVALYVDGAPAGTGSVHGPSLVDLSTTYPPRILHIGQGGGTALTGARIRRVFACPSPVLADCDG